ncbi:hypothetical protein C5S30_06120 [ANME-1 cluster archaeon GoMg4]|nr:hypothetical protein [ANME-1 cluster archaeon GoMg4]
MGNRSQVADYILPPEGRAYKENVPDTRESPVREMVKEALSFSFSTNLFFKRKALPKEGIKIFF